MKQLSSVIITSPEEQHSKTGTQGGGRGLAKLESSEIAVWLAKHTPADMDKAAVSRALSHGVNLEVKFEGRYPTGPNGEYLPSYEVAVGCRIHGTTAQREAAIEDLKKFQTPAPIPQIERWLAELSVLTAGRGTDGIAAELQLTAYSSRLAQFPADVVRYALLQHTWKWFPAWDELERLCKAKSSPRQHMIAALSQPEPDPEPKRRPPTDEERARIQAMVDQMFPRQSPADRKAAVDIALQGDCMVGDPEQTQFKGAAE